MGAGRDEDRSGASAEAIGHEVHDSVVEEVFLLVVLNKVPVAEGRADAVCGHGRNDCENHATETSVLSLDVVTNGSSPRG